MFEALSVTQNSQNFAAQNSLHRRARGPLFPTSGQLYPPLSVHKADADLALPRVRTEAGRRRLLFSIVQFYNRLPPETRALSLGSFKREVLQLLDK